MNNLNAAYITLRLIRKIRSVHDRMEAQTLEMLALIAQNPNITVGELADRASISLSSAVRNVDRLGEGTSSVKGVGLVIRYDDPLDRRVKCVKLTKKGEEFWREYTQVLTEAVGRTTGND